MRNGTGARVLAGVSIVLPLLLGHAEVNLPPAGSGGAAEFVASDVLARVERELEQREYRVSRNSLGLQAPNRAHDLRIYFEPTGIRVHDRTGAADAPLLTLSLAGVGREAALGPAEPGVLSSQDARVEIRRGALLEWYENSARGLEQGFTLAERPAGAGPLALELAVTGADASLRGDAVLFATTSGRTLQYAALRATDAAGNDLAARLAVTAAGRVRLEIEDAAAVYPVVVDPLLGETSDARIESDDNGSYLGSTVATADVNGDGYADALISAPYYDAGEGAEGVIFVFHGGPDGIASGTPASANARIEGNQVSAHLGGAVSAGDVNGDGYEDVIATSNWYDAGPSRGKLVAFVFLGSAAGITDRSPTTANARLESDQTNSTSLVAAGAGDVNGDGYDDVIVGDYNYTAGQYLEGAAFLFLGGPAGIASGGPATANTRIESNQLAAQLGSSVAGAGDVNGDGYDDVIIGAAKYYTYQPGTAGAAFIFLGSATGIANGNPTTAATRLTGNQSGGGFGDSVAKAGDVNGDGYGDVIVGAPYFTHPGGLTDGSAFVFLGGPNGIPDGGFDTADARIDCDQELTDFGNSVAGAGDVNGDGYADVIVGAPNYTTSAYQAGAAFLFLGGATGIASGTLVVADARLEGDQLGEAFASSVTMAGDVNGDGYADVIVGSPYHDLARTDEGIANVYLGGAAGIVDGNPGSASARLVSDQTGGFLGWSVAGAGDVNGDGYADLIVGAPSYDAGETDEGAAFVFLGSSAGITGSSPADAAAQLESNQAGAWFGHHVASAGDVNGDGYDDVIVSAYLYDAGETDEGAVFIFLGSATGIASGNPTTAATRLESNQAGAQLGYRESAAGAGDVNGDGYADVIVGAPFYHGPANSEGAVFVFLGGPDGIANGDPSSAATRLWSDQNPARFGFSVAGAGDVNGDGFADVIVGSTSYQVGQSLEGAAFVFLGNVYGIPDGGPATAQARIESDQVLGQLGFSVAGAGDVNGDGYADVIVGAPFYDDGQTDEGEVLVLLGSANGIASGNLDAASARLQGDLASSFFGFSVAGAGDVNGDGYADVIVGANRYSASQTAEGAAFVFLGSSTGIASGSVASAAAQLQSDQANALLGWSVAGIGDVNGDGFADVSVGAPGYDASAVDEGAAFVFLGGGNRSGRRVLAQQLRGDASGIAVQPWGGSLDAQTFLVALDATHPEGRGRVKLEVEACGAGFPFGHWRCVSRQSDSWSEVTPASGGSVRLTQTISGLNPVSLYRWRARVLYAPVSGTPPVAPPHGPWRRVDAEAREADVRVIPEAGALVSLLAGAALLAGLARLRRR
jgi:hypothetical protein